MDAGMTPDATPARMGREQDTMTTYRTRRQSLRRAVALARSGRLPVYRCGLAGCPVGGWAETTQAISRIADELPRRDARAYHIDQLIDALYDVDPATQRYIVRAEGR